MARKRNSINFPKIENPAQSIFIAAVVGVVIGLIVFNIFSSKSQQVTTQPTSSPVTEQISPETKSTSPVKLPTSHKVTFGDSLEKLSDKYYGDGNFWPGLAKANNLKNPSLIEPNTELKIPTKEGVKDVSVADLRTTGRDKITGTTYTVDYGDTLFEIAQRAYGDGSKWTLINNTNHLGKLANGNPLIHAGNVLVIPR